MQILIEEMALVSSLYKLCFQNLIYELKLGTVKPLSKNENLVLTNPIYKIQSPEKIKFWTIICSCQKILNS